MIVHAPRRPTRAGRSRWRMRRMRRWAIRLVAVVGAVIVVVCAITAFRVWQVGRQDHRPRSDVLLVLGAAQFDGRPSRTFAARLDHAYDLYRAGIAPVIVTVGGNQPGDRFTEAVSGKSYLEHRGVPASALVDVDSGSDTLLSLRAATPVFAARGWHSVVLVTDPWHSLRSRTMARDLGLRAQTSPTRTGPGNAGGLAEVHYIGRETAAYLYYRTFHRP